MTGRTVRQLGFAVMDSSLLNRRRWIKYKNNRIFFSKNQNCSLIISRKILKIIHSNICNRLGSSTDLYCITHIFNDFYGYLIFNVAQLTSSVSSLWLMRTATLDKTVVWLLFDELETSVKQFSSKSSIRDVTVSWKFKKYF